MACWKFPCSLPDPLPTLLHPALHPSCWPGGPEARHLLCGFPLRLSRETHGQRTRREKSQGLYSPDALLMYPLRLVVTSTKGRRLLVILSLSLSLSLSCSATPVLALTHSLSLILIVFFPLNLSGLQVVWCMIFVLPVYTHTCCFFSAQTFMKYPFIKLSSVTTFKCAICFLQGAGMI